MFLHYGPLLSLFDFSTSYTWGCGRETCYILQTPSYAYLGFRNYYTECFIHMINIIEKWPLAFRKMLQRNCSVNLSGRKDGGIEMDAWIETCIVQPMKVSSSGHTTVKIASNIDYVKLTRDAFWELMHIMNIPLNDTLYQAPFHIK